MKPLRMTHKGHTLYRGEDGEWFTVSPSDLPQVTALDPDDYPGDDIFGVIWSVTVPQTPKEAFEYSTLIQEAAVAANAFTRFIQSHGGLTEAP